MMKYYTMLMAVVISLLTHSVMSQEMTLMPESTAHSFQFSQVDGSDIDLSQFKGKPLLVVNTASQCGFTPQYAALEKLYQTYKDQGLVVIAVPSNDFGGQEPGSDQDILSFTEEKYDISFPVVAKTAVKGKEAHPFYRWANKEVGFLGSPKWNFHKYLIAPDGTIAKWYSSATTPDSKKVTEAIENLL